jgi:hypothetical protein
MGSVSVWTPAPPGTRPDQGNGVRTVIVEDASRFARQLMTQELGIALLISRLFRRCNMSASPRAKGKV